MKVRIEMDETLLEDEVTIRCREVTDSILEIQRVLKEKTAPVGIVFYKSNQEHFFPVQQVLFFETEGDRVYAHTATDAYRVKRRLYELEGMLPGEFLRISKSTVLNIRHISAINRNITAASLVQFDKSHKQVYCSRNYYKELQNRLKERKRYE